MITVKQIDYVWNDIKKRNKLVLCSLLLKCCIESKRIQKNDFIQALNWIENTNYILNIKGKYIATLSIDCGKQYYI